MKIEVEDVKITSNLSLNTSVSLWDDFLTSRQGNIENKGFFYSRVCKFKKMTFFDT